MARFIIIPEDEGVALQGFNCRADIIDNIRYEMAEMHGDAAKTRELRRLRNDVDWESTPGPDEKRLQRHQQLIDWVIAAEPGDMYVEKISTNLKDYQITGRIVFCLNDSVGDVRRI
jgi:hypothetical protein